MWPASAFRFSPSVVAVLDATDGRIVDVNPAFEQVLGIARAEAIGKPTIDLGIWADVEARASIWMRIRSAQRVCGDVISMRSRDGKALHGRLYAELFQDGGRNCVFVIIQDIATGDGAAARTAEQAAIDSYRSLFDAAAEGIYRSLPEGGFVDVNLALAKMFGYESPAELLCAPRRHGEEWYVDKEHAHALVAELQREGHVVNAISRIYRRDGSVIWISENARVIRNSDGQIAFYEGTVIDITERIAAEMRLRQSQALYKTLVDNCRDGVFLTQEGKLLFANRALAEMLGYPLENLPRAYIDLIACHSRARRSLSAVRCGVGIASRAGIRGLDAPYRRFGSG